MSSALYLAAFLFTAAIASAETAIERGAALYQTQCTACHQPKGEGIRGMFPPLADSDFLLADKERSIRFVLQGNSGTIVVNKVSYIGAMPPHPSFDDQMVADVLTYVRSAWGNRGDAVTPALVKKVRADLAANDTDKKDPFAPLPAAPAGFRLREVARLPAHGVRLATLPGANWFFVLNNLGDLFRLEPATGAITRLLAAKEYADLSPGPIDALGMTIDRQKRLYVVTNQRVSEKPFHTNRVVVFRSAPLDAAESSPVTLAPWLRTSYPWGNSYYNHGVSHIAEGPDGMMYISSGARTDGGEAGTVATIWKGGETETTAAIWRVDPNQQTPAVEVFARGIRNAWSFAWNDRGELFTASNGPDADMPEELDFVEAGKHYGFPYQFNDSDIKPYPHTPQAPPGLLFTHAIRNFGPAAGGASEKPIATFDSHSSPAGMLFCGPEWPATWRGKLLLGRFGNLIKERDVGYDILAIDLKRNAAGIYEAHTETFLAPVARPLDLMQVGQKLYILEYTRPIGNHTGRPTNPGRVLELSW